MKKILFFLILTSLFAFNTSDIIKNIIGEQKYTTYKGLLKETINDQNASLKEIITALKENGLIDLFFKKPKLTHPTFIFINNNPVFNTKTLYETLQNLGYYYFYPSKIIKKENYSITLEINSNHHIDPLNFLNEIEHYGCKVIEINKKEDFTYKIDCENEIVKAIKLSQKTKSLVNAKGEYWIETGGFKKAYIKTSKYDFWYPYIVFYDKNLNILNIITSEFIQRQITLNIPENCKYIKIRDNYTKENFKRGIFIKGLQ